MDYLHASPWLDNTMPRAIKNLDISLGLATIPVQLFSATSSQGVASHLLHAKCGSRIQMRLECPIHGPVPREETVRGFETSKDEYVRFEPEELKALLRSRLLRPPSPLPRRRGLAFGGSIGGRWDVLFCSPGVGHGAYRLEREPPSWRPA